MPTRTEEITREVRTGFGAELKQFNAEQDHVHLLVHHPPEVQLSKPDGSCGGAPLTLVKQYIENQQCPA